MNPLLTQFASAFCWVLYGSFYEWFFHKFWMHQPRPPKEAFRGHTIVHHGLYKGDESYFVPVGKKPERILLKPYALPVIVLMHIPFLYLIERFLVSNTFTGGLIACTTYFVIYEYMHWNMHVPRGHFVERFGWFQFLREHHHIHHRHSMKNFCVLFPLADWMMGTLETRESLAQKKAEREAAIARGEVRSERKMRSRGAIIRERAELAEATPLAKPLTWIERYRQWKQGREQSLWKQERKEFQAKRGQQGSLWE